MCFVVRAETLTSYEQTINEENDQQMAVLPVEVIIPVSAK